MNLFEKITLITSFAMIITCFIAEHTENKIIDILFETLWRISFIFLCIVISIKIYQDF